VNRKKSSLFGSAKCLLALTFWLLSSSLYLSGQGYPDGGIFHGTEIESVDLTSGNLHIQIPVHQEKGRGLNTGTSFVFDTHFWKFYTFCSGLAGCTDVPSFSVTPLTIQGPNDYTLSLKNVGYAYPGGSFSGGITYEGFSNYSLQEPNGTVHSFDPETVAPAEAYSGGSFAPVPGAVQTTRMYAKDSSGIQLVLNSNATIVNAILPDGTIVFPGQIKDRNGNTVTSNGWVSDSTDTLNRTWYRDGSFYDASGAYRQVSVTTTRVSYQTHMCNRSEADECHETSGTADLPETITLPNGMTYSFTYEQNGGLEPSSMTLPGGSRVQWTWSDNSNWPMGGRLATSRMVTSDGVSGTWSYNYTTNGGEVWSATMTDPDLNDTLFSNEIYPDFSGNYRLQVRYLGSVGQAIPIQTVKTEYASYPSFPNRVTTTWNQTGETSKSETDWDQVTVPDRFVVSRGNPVAMRDYGWGNGSPGTLLRTTTYTYKYASNPSYESANLVRLPELVSVTDGTFLSQTQYSYDDFPLIPRNGATGHDDNVYGASFNVRGNLTTISRWRNTDGAWLPTTYTYDSLGNRLTGTDPRGLRTQYSYDDNPVGGCQPGQSTYAYPTSIIDAKGFTTRMSYYYCNGLLGGTRDPNDIAAGRDGTVFTYEMMGRPSSIVYPPGGGSTTYSYIDTPPLSLAVAKQVSDGSSITKVQNLDGMGRIKQTRNPDGSSVDVTYDKKGRVGTVSNPYFSTSDTTYGFTQYSYDPLDRTTALQRPDDTVASITYLGTCSTATDITSVKTCTDPLGRLTKVFEDPAGLNYETDYTYDAAGNLWNVTQNGSDVTQARVRQFTYNSLSELISANNPETGSPNIPASGRTIYIYDPDGNVQTKTNGLGTVTYGYDELNRLKTKSYSDQTTPSVTYVYDNGTEAIHRLVSSTSGVASSTIGYDPMGRMKTSTQCVGSTCGTVVAHFNYLGSLDALTYPSARSLSYKFDSVARLSAVMLDSFNGTSVNYPYYAISPDAGYSPSGLVTKAVFGNGLFEFTHQNKRFQIDGFTVSKSPTVTCGPNSGANLMQIGLNLVDPTSRGNNGNVWSTTDYINSAHNQTFTYDTLNRIKTAVQADNSISQTYSIDAWGNTQQSGPPNNFIQAFTTRNQVLGACYDAVGNLQDLGNCQTPHTYSYDAENRIVSTQGGASYTYSADGLRVAKTSGGSTTLYFYFGSQPVAELSSDGTWSDYIFAGSRRIAVTTSIGQSDPNASNPAIYTNYYHQDQLGSSRLMSSGTFASDGQSWSSIYAPFGQLVGSDIPSHYKFTGKERDAESGNDYFGARYYASSMGRMLSPDPVFASAARVMDPQQWNMYAYARNNPLSITDPTGMDFNLKCNDGETMNCSGGYQGQYQYNSGSGQFEFEKTDVDMNKQGDPSAGYSDQFGNNYTGTFDQNNGVSFTNTATGATSGQSQFVDGSDPTQLKGSGAFSGIQGNFFDACGGNSSCQGRATLSGSAAAFDNMKSTLSQSGRFSTLLDGFSLAHPFVTDQYRGGVGGYAHVIKAPGYMWDMHFEGSSPGAGVTGFALHMLGTIKEMVDGTAIGERSKLVPEQ